MKLNKLLAAGSTLLLAAGLLALGATSVSAHTPTATADCSGLTVSLTNYQAIQSGHDAVTETLYQRYSWTGGQSGPSAASTPTNDAANWQLDHKKYDNSPVGQQIHIGQGNGSWFYWTSTPVTTPATAEKANTVVVTIDGGEKANLKFGNSYVKTFPNTDLYAAHTYKVDVKAWDDSKYDFHFTKTVAACSFDTTKPDQKVEYKEWVDGAQDCTSRTVTQTRQKTATDYTLVNHVWVPGTPVITTETQARGMTKAEIDVCAGGQPQAKIAYTQWTDTDQNCDSRTVSQDRYKTVTPFVLKDGAWIAGLPSTPTVEHQVRLMTSDELSVCAGAQPKVEVTTANHSVKDCGARTVATTVTTTSVASILDTTTNTWVKDKPVVTEETHTFPATEEDCPIAVTPPTKTETLAATGTPESTGWMGLGAFGLLLLGGAALLLSQRRKVTE